MKLEDDTPDPHALPDLYPGEPPRNLLPAALLAPRNFYVFEGLDGSGKSTIIGRVHDELTRRGRAAVRRKLGGAAIIRHAMERAKWTNTDPVTFNLLNWVSLYDQMVALRDLYDTDTSILVDRYTLTVRIRGTLEGLTGDLMDVLERGLPRPTTLFIVDCDVDTCIDRVHRSNRAITYFEAGTRHVDRAGDPMVEHDPVERTARFDREATFRRHLERMRQAYLALARRYPDVVMVDNAGPIEAAVASVLGRIARDHDA